MNAISELSTTMEKVNKKNIFLKRNTCYLSWDTFLKKKTVLRKNHRTNKMGGHAMFVCLVLFILSAGVCVCVSVKDFNDILLDIHKEAFP